MLNVDQILSEFHQRLQKIENNMEICKMSCQILRKFLKFPKPSKLFIPQFIFSMHSFHRRTASSSSAPFRPPKGPPRSPPGVSETPARPGTSPSDPGRPGGTATPRLLSSCYEVKKLPNVGRILPNFCQFAQKFYSLSAVSAY